MFVFRFADYTTAEMHLFLAALERDDEVGGAAGGKPLPRFDVRHLGVG